MDLQIGTTLHGFTVEQIEEVTEFDGIAYIMRHAVSGARLLYLSSDDENKAFAITFKTPPVDNTGVFHILEHSVLCGSEKFPVKEPFVNLLKSSMQTFLNAMTFPDKTMYPVASTNEQDLLNLMDVYMDAVLHPNIYEKRAIFEQEGWHYEMDSPEDPLRLNGVVYNEMKGALSDPDSVLYNALCAAVFPDTAYAFESGGDPKAIPELTYESYLDSHRRHYRLDNSYIMLYGDMEVENELAFLDEHYLSVEQAPAEQPNPLNLQEPIIAKDVVRKMQTAPENACLGVAYIVGTVHDRDRNIAIDVLMDTLMGSNEAPLKRALLDSQIADDAHGYLVDEQLQPMVIIQVKGVKPDSKEVFQTIVNETVAQLCQEGLPKDRLEASLSRAEFAIRERDFGIADGVVLGMQSMVGWLYDDSLATAYLRYEDAFAAMRKGIDKGYFEELLHEIILDSDHKAHAEVVPVEVLDEGKEAEKLAVIKDAMTPAEIQQVIKEAETLRDLQEEPDTPEAIATLPLLKLEDIGEMRVDPACELIESTPLPCLYHDIPTRHIDYAYHYFDIDCIDFEDLPYVGLLMRLLGKLDTAKHSADELDNLIQARLGSMRFFLEVYGDESDPSIITPKFVVSTSSLAENISYLAELPAEVWSSTIFDNTAKIKDMLQQSRIAMEQEFANSGHSAALARAASYYTPSAIIREQLAGIDFYRFLKDLLAHFDERADDLVARLYSTADKLFVQDGTVTSFTGSREELDAFWEQAGTLSLSHCALNKPLVVPEPVKKNEAFIVSSDVCFAGKGYDRRLLKIPYSGVWQVAGRILSFDYLWSEVRVKGGAYGAGFRADRSGGMQFYSYRDPNLDATLARFDATGKWLASFSPEEEAMRGYIISSVAGYDAPKKPREIARRQDAEYFGKLDPDWIRKARDEVLATTPEELKALAPVFDSLAEQNAQCVFGNRDILENAQTKFEVIDLLA